MKMLRFAPYLGIVAALAVGILIAVFSGSTTVLYVPTISIPTVSPEPLKSIATTTSTQTVPVQNKKTLSTPAPVVSPPPPAQSTAEINAKLDISASALRAALVNILCLVPAGSSLHSISGSGIFIDSKGIILTNAHIGQYFLLANRSVSCSIRSGSPATDRYDASLIYISPTWLQINPKVLTEAMANGTGEYDVALLAVSKSATSDPLPSSFPSLPLATTSPAASAPVVIASYGAQFLATNQIASDLSPTIVFGSIKDIFTFGTNTIDVIALGGSAAAQEGSSGGGVADTSSNLIGTITTSTVSGATDTRSLNAITASYIRAEYASETGEALDILLNKSTASSISDFAPQLSGLEAIITAQLH